MVKIIGYKEVNQIKFIPQTTPLSAQQGDAYVNTDGSFYVHNGSSWIQMASNSHNHDGLNSRRILMSDVSTTGGNNGQVFIANGSGGGYFGTPAVSGGTQLFTSTGTWTAPAGITRIYITAVGGGAGGGGGWANPSGGGGSGGALIKFPITVVPSTIYNITIGSGGLGGSGNATGSDGLNTTFSTLATAYGGKGGLTSGIGGLGGENGATSTSIDGVGGVAGHPGTTGQTNPTISKGGGGAGGYYGVGGNGGGYDCGGENATGYGAGGGGCGNGTKALHGGAGSDGLLIVEW